MKVSGKQRNSRMCFICGMENPVGLKSQFYNMEDGGVLTILNIFRYTKASHSGMHGGLIANKCLSSLLCADIGYWTKQ